VGYYSADFHHHATCVLIAEMLESHDRERFETYGFSFGPRVDDAMRRRISRAFTRFIDVAGRSDVEIARLSRELRIDIAVDLKGHTQDSRPGIFAERCAPVQASFLGYPGTMGAGFIDYVIADKTVIPPHERQHYAEQVVWLPGSHQPNDSTRAISERVYTRAELGLPEQGFVFCCFNQAYKILPATFAVWMRVLRAVPGSVLWLLEDNPYAARQLRDHAQAAGIEPERLVFAQRMPLPEHLARQRQADLFVDTLPYNAGTTASDALWAGLPVLTCAGRSFASRLAASLLHALDLPELITRSQAAYEARAIELATDPQQLAALRRRLHFNRDVSTLFDGKDHARRLEKAYTAMHDRLRAGQAPAPLDIERAELDVTAAPDTAR
jgi:predicted O-linked N-acetylglucosamine transferase (SPINDLY family)